MNQTRNKINELIDFERKLSYENGLFQGQKALERVLIWIKSKDTTRDQLAQWVQTEIDKLAAASSNS